MSENSDKLSAAKERFVTEIANDERYKSFFSQYRDDSVKHFIDKYAFYKANLESFGDYTKYRQQRALAEWQDGGWLCLKEIQHKKLFDLSCNWQMERVKNLPEIETSYDFKYVGYCILDYEGIPDISEEDLDFYRSYLSALQNTHGYHIIYTDYHEYKDIKEKYDEHGETGINYYDYYDSQKGIISLLNDDPVRLIKEEVYLEFALDIRRAKPLPPKKKEKPYLDFRTDSIVKFARKFKELKIAAYIEDYEEFQRQQPGMGQEWASMYLEDVFPEKVPVTSNSNWLDAVYEAAVIHRQKKINEWLPSVYEEYLLKKSSGIRLSRPEDKERGFGRDVWYRNMILEGREMKGEPRNFDF